MSKTLHLLRHAKSAWDDPGIGDRERGLNKRGRRNAPQMGAVLADRLEPKVIHVSPARRAQLTLGGLQDGWEAIHRDVIPMDLPGLLFAGLVFAI